MSRRKQGLILLLTGYGLLAFAHAQAELTLPLSEAAKGSDGALTLNAYRENRTIDLGLATTGSWDAVSDGNGIYDPDEWAVVFKYSSVSLSGNDYQRVYYENHPTGAPVVWLVSGDVYIQSGDSVNLNGGGHTNTQHAVPGPGGYWGGVNKLSDDLLQSAGFGPGGGLTSDAENPYGGSGSHYTEGNYRAGPIYGNVRLLPLRGGSGGAGIATHGGSAGGGAILIVASGTVTIDGSINANGGTAGYRWNSGLGSGGAVRIVADTLTGLGIISAAGRVGNDRPTASGDGRIRLEANNVGGSLVTIPLSYVVAPDDPILIWPPDGAPMIEVVSIGVPGNVPDDPAGSIYAEHADVILPDMAAGDIELTSANVDPSAGVEVRIVPKYGDPIITTAAFITGDATSASWRVTNVTFPEGHFTVQARAVNP